MAVIAVGDLQFLAAAEERSRRYEDRYITSPDPSITGLRAFIAYHKDARENYEIAGKVRSLTHKQVQMYGLLSRLEVTGEKTTMTAIAKEAHVVVSTVSRFLDKLQVWGAYIVDVKRGKYGGITIRKAVAKYSEYAARAWARVRKAAEKALNRAGFNVASSSQGRDMEAKRSTTYMDATLKLLEACDGRWHPSRACDEVDHSPLPASAASRAADQEQARAADFARRTVIEIRRLQREEPDWDAYLDKVRSSYGLD